MPSRTIEPAPQRQPRVPLQDTLAVVIGYGMAAIFFRAFWPPTGLPAGLGLLAVGLYLWLGLALSGPIILIRRGAGRHRPSAEPPPTELFTWSEWAWLFVGIYWIVLGLFVIPARLDEFRAGDVLLFGLVPILVAVVLRLVGTKVPTERSTAIWTHFAGIALLATWPVAWAFIIILGRRLH